MVEVGTNREPCQIELGLHNYGLESDPKLHEQISASGTLPEIENFSISPWKVTRYRLESSPKWHE